MAEDRMLFRSAESGIATVRLYQWAGKWVTLGRSQTPSEVQTLYREHLPVIRPTGGGLVFHGADQTVAMAMPLESLALESRRVREIYRALVRPLGEALSAAGLECELAEDREEQPASLCFASVGRLDLVSPSGKKVAGCAMAISRSAALLQSSIPLGTWNPALLGPALQRAWEARGFTVELQPPPRSGD